MGYLLKDAPPEELATAVLTAAAGKSALAPAIALQLMDRMRAPDAALSRREIELWQLVADGHSNLQISQQLFLVRPPSSRTWRTATPSWPATCPASQVKKLRSAGGRCMLASSN